MGCYRILASLNEILTAITYNQSIVNSDAFRSFLISENLTACFCNLSYDHLIIAIICYDI